MSAEAEAYLKDAAETWHAEHGGTPTPTSDNAFLAAAERAWFATFPPEPSEPPTFVARWWEYHGPRYGGPRERHFVYRLYGRGGLIYIGFTSNLQGRLRTHQANLGDELIDLRVEEYSTRDMAYAVEQALIAETQPPLNRKGCK